MDPKLGLERMYRGSEFEPVSTSMPMTDRLRRACVLLHFLAWFGLVDLVFLHVAVAAEGSDATEDKPNSIAVFGGLVTDNNWEDMLAPWDLDYRESLVAGVAISRRIGRFDPRLSFEIEGQVVRHFGDQDHWELNLPIIGRWEAFPWDDVIDTSVAFGIGPSYASEIPMVEVANGGDSQQWLVYWMMELDIGPLDKNWSALFRVHHRSGAFGLVADEGGSNALVIGLKQRF